MKPFPRRLALFGLGLLMLALAAALALGFIELLSHPDLGRLGADASYASRTSAQAGSLQAVLVEALEVFEMLAQWMAALAVLVGVLVLPMLGLVLLGVGGVCLHDSVRGLPEPTTPSVAQPERAESHARYAEPEGDALPRLQFLLQP